MKLIRQLLILIFCLGVFLPNLAVAQSSIGFNIGMASYEGDLNKFGEADMDIWSSGGLSVGFYGKKSLGDFFNVGLAYQFARFTGDDSDFGEGSGFASRNFSFANSMHEVTLKADLEPFKSWKVSPFLSAGAGVAFNNPGTIFDISNKSDEQIARISQDETEVPSVILAIPVGVGFNFNLTEKLAINSEFAMRLPISDYLDGVSVSAASEYNDYFGSGVIGLTYTIGNTKTTEATLPAVKDENL